MDGLQTQIFSQLNAGSQVTNMDWVKSASKNTSGVQNPPSTGLLMGLALFSRHSFTNMTIPQHDIFLTGQTLQSNGTTGVNLIRRNTNFGTETIFKTIGKTR